MTAQHDQGNDFFSIVADRIWEKEKPSLKGIITVSVIVLLVFIGSCSMLRACGGKTDQEKISAMVAADGAIKTVIRTQEPKDFCDRVNEIVDKMGKERTQYADGLIKKIKESDMPEDFRSAYLNHARAWKRNADVCLNHPHLPTGFFNMMGKVAFGGVGAVLEWCAKYDSSMEDIDETWKEVIKVGAQYGVPIK